MVHCTQPTCMQLSRGCAGSGEQKVGGERERKGAGGRARGREAERVGKREREREEKEERKQRQKEEEWEGVQTHIDACGVERTVVGRYGCTGVSRQCRAVAAHDKAHAPAVNGEGDGQCQAHTACCRQEAVQQGHAQ